jgi:polyisoprenyl-teichoic acid--peptidoglycan teichoic acid transferase
MHETTTLNWPRIIIQSSLLATTFLLIPVLLLVIVVALQILPFIQSFMTSAELTQEQLISRIQSGWRQEPPLSNGKYVVVALGTDELPNRQDMPIMTDTIILASLDLKQGSLHTISIPRDYWSDQFQTKINSLYEYGRKQDSTRPYELLLQELSTLTPAQIDSVITISPTKLMHLIEILEGIEIDVPVEFTDSRFPRDDVDITRERDPKKLYETISFAVGPQTMTGRQAMQYMRSRNGTNGQNDDIARAERQTLVLQSILHKLSSVETLKNAERLAQLWKFYQQEFDSSLSFETLISLARYRINHVGWKGTIRATLAAATDFTITQASIPVTRYDQVTKKIEPGILYNPPIQKQKYFGQWVYIATDSAVLSTYITTKLNYD